MTSEICVMNKLGVVLAADSASTVRQTTNEGFKERYFKGANKIFQVSNHHPVGVMIYDSADIMNVPWELVIKSFRAHLGNQSCGTVKGYADRLFRYIEENLNLFPEDVQLIELTRASFSSAINFMMSIKRNGDDIDNDAINNCLEYLSNQPYPSSVTDEVETQIFDKIKDNLVIEIESIRSEVEFTADAMLIAKTAFSEVIRNPEVFLGTTGLIFAGYGENAAFPSMTEYLISGLIGGKVIYQLETEDLSVDHHRPAQIKAFAQTSMSDTFIRGLSLDLFGSVMDSSTKGLHKLAQDILSSANLAENDVPNLEQIISDARLSISNEVLAAAQEQHSIPMRQVLGVLPIEEMVELAETLINLQSLKEKVTRPSETVGGPVDVAVITKCEGLIWIKRKHYFNLDINSRYAQRLTTIHARD